MIAREGSKVSIIGAGAVGSSLAYASLIRGVTRHLVLQDINEAKVKAEALDLMHGGQFMPEAIVQGTADVAVTENSDVIVITAGAKQKPGQTRLDLAQSTVRLMSTMLPPLAERSPDAIFLMVTNPVDVTTMAAIDILGLPPERVFGSGTVLDSARLRQLVASRVGVSVSNVHAYVAGEHGDSETPLWSTATIGGVPIEEWESQTGQLGFDEREDIANRVINAAYEVIAGKGATNYAIGVVGAHILRTILRDEQAILPVSRQLNNWHGMSDTCISVPTLVGASGATRQLELPLSEHEKAALEYSADQVHSTYDDLKHLL
ncbi:L-lactate dehydrogenase [Trueperella bialowiezensis]|uniref:L-lactate dehydrogenase n=1 Tax=Trueperella bialowiezensis TaxID=312285 RepID=A0A3S5EW12_9ACTO|nr:L-lactate dehydrogenase [Trueperella bialowiezensis]VEI13083.1 L-lactate dehydrogenase 2 [Trueperella bialowiezensis]